MASLRKKNIIYSLILLASVVIVWLVRNSGEDQPETDASEGETVAITGTTFGVVEYNVKYVAEADISPEADNLKAGIDSILNGVNSSLSTYIEDSEISEFNRDNLHKYESPYFFPVLAASREVFEETGGAFDPTVAPLVNAWGFGPGKNREPEKVNVDSLLEYVGFDSVFFDSTSVCKMKKGVQLDFSAVAKGYAVDLVAEYLQSQGLENIFVEIGGELACYGKNDRGEAWVIGIDSPVGEEENRSINQVVQVQNRAMATSGNYRNFYVKDDIRYSHTISPVTGKPVEHTLLSATVFSEKCMYADAYATAFMVAGMEKAREIVESNQDLDAYFIYSDENGELKTYATAGIKDFLKK